MPDLEAKQAGKVLQILKCNHSGEVTEEHCDRKLMIKDCYCWKKDKFMIESKALHTGWKSSMGGVDFGNAFGRYKN